MSTLIVCRFGVQFVRLMPHKLTKAFASLQIALSNLRKHLKPFVEITRDQVCVSPGSEIWMDANVFECPLTPFQSGGEITSPLVSQEVAQAVELYQGDFLRGFHLRGCASFEEWVAVEREGLHLSVIAALEKLIHWDILQGEYEAGIRYGKHLLQIDPLNEKGHRILMRLYQLGGKKTAALSQYETCRRILAEELGATPEYTTYALYQQIFDGTWEKPAPIRSRLSRPELQKPAFLRVVENQESERRVFVARERELTRLDEYLKCALDGQGEIVFLS